ncbi:sensor histidine kinase [Cellulomonas sp. NPDC089187]|uniref:sensor histidine kinase n=1 Tax=Cellulomonas sp. NPDC089187 TaxID=3154970 RepID=UPI00341C5666
MTAVDPTVPAPAIPRGWDSAFYLLTGLSAASMLVADHRHRPVMVVALCAVVGLIVAYPLVGRRGALTGDRRRVRYYLALLVVVVALASGSTSPGSLLLVVGYSQIWLLTPSLRSGIGWCAALTGAVGVSIAAGQALNVQELPVLLGQLGIGLLFSLAMGWWLTRIDRSREQRAELLRRLHAAEDELAARHHAAGVLAERGRVAQEIHDTLAQGFTSVVMLAQTAQAQVEHGQVEPAAERLAQIEAVARENLAEARSLVAAFGPSGLTEGDLSTALHRVGDRLHQETGLIVSVQVEGDIDLGREQQVALLRTAQEALNNVRRHAHADHVTVRMTSRDHRVELEVVDDGRGLPPDATDGVGLRGMRQRIAAAGGQVQVSRAEPGVRVLATLPVEGRSA